MLVLCSRALKRFGTRCCFRNFGSFEHIRSYTHHHHDGIQHLYTFKPWRPSTISVSLDVKHCTMYNGTMVQCSPESPPFLSLPLTRSTPFIPFVATREPQGRHRTFQNKLWKSRVINIPPTTYERVEQNSEDTTRELKVPRRG